MKQLHKIVSVIKVVDFTDIPAVTREMMFVKVQAEHGSRRNSAHRGNIPLQGCGRDLASHWATGDQEKLRTPAWSLLQRFGIKEPAQVQWPCSKNRSTPPPSGACPERAHCSSPRGRREEPHNKVPRGRSDESLLRSDADLSCLKTRPWPSSATAAGSRPPEPARFRRQGEWWASAPAAPTSELAKRAWLYPVSAAKPRPGRPIMILLPDEVQATVCKSDIKPTLPRARPCFFARHNIHSARSCAQDVDVFLILGPRSSGAPHLHRGQRPTW